MRPDHSLQPLELYLRYIAALVTGDNRIQWQHMVQFDLHEQPGITITIATGYSSRVKASKISPTSCSKTPLTGYAKHLTARGFSN
jgi:hypothetical protein